MSEKIIVVFSRQAEEAFSTIVKKYHLEESSEEKLSYTKLGKFTRLIMMYKAIEAFAKEGISKEDFGIALMKILKTDQEKTKEIVEDIIKNLTPYLEKFPEEKLNDLEFRKMMVKKIFPNESNPQTGIKDVELKDVEENAQRLKKERVATTEGTVGEELNHKGRSDKYRESIEE